jgi:hypothetical protein
MVGVHGRTRNNVTHSDNGRQVHLRGLQNWKVDGYCAETNEVFEYLGCFLYWFTCMPNRHKSIGKTDETEVSRFEETIAKLKKIKTQVIKLLRSGVVSLENYCEIILALKMNCANTPMGRILTLILLHMLTVLQI